MISLLCVFQPFYPSDVIRGQFHFERYIVQVFRTVLRTSISYRLGLGLGFAAWF